MISDKILYCSYSSSTVDEWEAFSTNNIAKAERERKASVALRSEINSILMQSFADLRGLYENVNNMFDKRIEETMEAKRKLERELARVSYTPILFLMNERVCICFITFLFILIHLVSFPFLSPCPRENPRLLADR